MSVGGSEEPRLCVMDVDTGEVIDGPIDRMRDPWVAWLPGGQAFYYTRFLESTEDGQPWLHRRVYLHAIGSDDDRLIWGDGAPKGQFVTANVSDDGRWLFVGERQGTDPRRDIWLADLHESDPAAPALRPLQVGVDALTWPVPLGDDLYLFTDRDAPRGRICVAPAADPIQPTGRPPGCHIPIFRRYRWSCASIGRRTRCRISTGRRAAHSWRHWTPAR